MKNPSARWLVLAFMMTASVCQAADNPANTMPKDWSAIWVNQAGYMSHWPKRALVKNPLSEWQTVDLINVDTNEKVAEFPLATPEMDMHSNDRVAAIEFEQFQQQGTYRLQIGDVKSPIFRIGERVFDELSFKLLRSYYLQRCGVALDDPITGLQHGLDHHDDGVLLHSDEVNPQGLAIESTGGWHDAGDFGKYVTTTTVAIGEILDTYARSPQSYPDKQLRIPESGNQQSDLLDEVEVGLRWLLTMQRSDGAVYRKLSGDKWPQLVVPEADKQTRYVYGISSPETAKFAAVMAQAARVFRRTSPELAQNYEQAARQAWQWLATVKEQQTVDWYEKDDTGSGKYLYSDTDTELALLTDRDDRVWAAAELWLLTHEQEYLDYLQSENYLTEHLSIYEWKNPALLGVIHLLQDKNANLPAGLQKRLRNAVIDLANESLHRSQESAFKLANHRFIWGSNKMAAAEGQLLVAAYQLTGEDEYWQAALSQLNFILGTNPQGLSFVTGIGEQRVRHVAHIFARAIHQDIDGLLVGGANDLAQDGIAPKGLGILSYIDSEKAYSVNEYAIDYNSALIGLLGTLQQAANNR
jgi:endoglucanase